MSRQGNTRRKSSEIFYAPRAEERRNDDATARMCRDPVARTARPAGRHAGAGADRPDAQTLLDDLSLAEAAQASLRHKLRTQNMRRSTSSCSTTWSAATRASSSSTPTRTRSSDYADYITENLNPGADVLPRADRVLDNLYPEQDSSAVHTVDLPATWTGTTRATRRTPRRCTR